MKLILIALGAGAGCLLMTGSAIAGPCSAQIDMVSKQLAATDAGMGPTGGASTTMDQSAANPVSPSGSPQTPTTPATGTMNEASQNKATSAQDVQNQNTGQGTVADQAAGTASRAGGNSEAAAALARAQQLDSAGDAGCLTRSQQGAGRADDAAVTPLDRRARPAPGGAPGRALPHINLYVAKRTHNSDFGLVRVEITTNSD